MYVCIYQKFYCATLEFRYSYLSLTAKNHICILKKEKCFGSRDANLDGSQKCSNEYTSTQPTTHNQTSKKKKKIQKNTEVKVYNNK